MLGEVYKNAKERKMKRFLSFTLALLCTLWFGVGTVYADDYNVKDTDIYITIDTDEWYVFTRDNVLNNSEIKSVGVTAQYLHDSMISTDTYLHMYRIEENSRENIEFKIIKQNNTDINNFKNLSEKKLKKTGEILASDISANNWKLYSNDCQYIYFEYETTEHNVIEYYTVVNQEIYKLIALKSNNFSDIEKTMIQDIVDNVQYKINPMYANESNGISKYWSEYGIQTMVIIIIVILIAVAVLIVKKRKAIKNFIVGKRNPNEEMKNELKKTRYVEITPKKKTADSSMVTIDRQKRKTRKKR